MNGPPEWLLRLAGQEQACTSRPKRHAGSSLVRKAAEPDRTHRRRSHDVAKIESMKLSEFVRTALANPIEQVESPRPRTKRGWFY